MGSSRLLNDPKFDLKNLENQIFLNKRFSRTERYYQALLLLRIPSKSLGPFFSKVQKTLIFGTFLPFLNDPDFFRKNRRVRFLPLSY